MSNARATKRKAIFAVADARRRTKALRVTFVATAGELTYRKFPQKI